MLMNKSQSEQTWCPMTRINHDATFTGQVVMAATCIAEQCAMWRWADGIPKERTAQRWWPEEDDPQVEPARHEKIPADAIWMPITGEGEDIEGGYWVENPATVDAENAAVVAQRRGYCGLAGRPA